MRALKVFLFFSGLSFFSLQLKSQDLEVNASPDVIAIHGEYNYISAPRQPLLPIGVPIASTLPEAQKGSILYLHGIKRGSDPTTYLISLETKDGLYPYFEASAEAFKAMTGANPPKRVPTAPSGQVDLMIGANKEAYSHLDQETDPQKEAPKEGSLANCNVALTFDDGPHPSLTPKLADLLKKKNIPATFFVTAKNAAAYPKVMQKLISARSGEEPLFYIGNHTLNHPDLTKATDKKLQSEINAIEDNPDYKKAVAQQNGRKFFRCPYGAFNERVVKALVDAGYPEGHVQWDVDPKDWQVRDKTKVSTAIIDQVREKCADPVQREKGVVVLLHDIHASSIDAAEIVVNELADEVNFVTLEKISARNSSFRNLEDYGHGAKK